MFREFQRLSTKNHPSTSTISSPDSGVQNLKKLKNDQNASKRGKTTPETIVGLVRVQQRAITCQTSNPIFGDFW